MTTEPTQDMIKLSKQLEASIRHTLSPEMVQSVVENMVTNILSPFVRETMDRSEVPNSIHQEILRSVTPYIEGEIMATDMREIIQVAIVDQVKTFLAKSASDLVREELGLISSELTKQGGVCTDLAGRISRLEGQMSILVANLAVAQYEKNERRTL